MIACSRCNTPVLPEAFGAEQALPCPGCASPLLVEAFARALDGVAEEVAPVPVTADEGASCFFHAGNRAEVPCDSCGRYLCSVCDLQLDGRHLCPPCVESGRGLAVPERLVRERVLWDSVVLSIAVLPMLIFYLTVFTAPIALFLGFRHRRTPASLVRRNRFRLWLGILIASGQIGGWLWLAGVLVAGILES